MTADARMGSDELHQPSFWDLSDTAHRVMTAARQWCAGGGTDGRLRRAYLSLLRPGGVPDEVAAELVAAGHWTPAEDGDGYQVDWSRQSTAAEVEYYKSRKRINQRRYRARMAEQARTELAGAVTGNATVDGVTGHVGQARPGPLLSSVPPPPPRRGGGGGGTGTDARARTRDETAPPDPASESSSTPARASARRDRGQKLARKVPPASPPAVSAASSPPAADRPRACPPGDYRLGAAAAKAELEAVAARKRLRVAPDLPTSARRPHPPPDPWHQLPLNLWIDPAGEPVPVPPVEELFPTVYATA